MDQQIEELKELVRRNIAVAEDTNRLMHGMRRSAWWGVIFRVVWWLTLIGVTSYLLAPYVHTLQQFVGAAGDWQAQFSDLLGKVNPK